jgi:hypothetical protein
MNVLSSVVLVVVTLAMALGLGAVTASLTPSLRAGGDPAPTRLLVGFPSGARGPEGNLRGAGDALSQPAPMPMSERGAPSPAALPRVSATGPWKSPLYPQNGVTVWDRIRVSTQRDRRAFLLGTAIQIHAGAAGASPSP